jgi:hypothetical protein
LLNRFQSEPRLTHELKWQQKPMFSAHSVNTYA